MIDALLYYSMESAKEACEGVLNEGSEAQSVSATQPLDRPTPGNSDDTMKAEDNDQSLSKQASFGLRDNAMMIMSLWPSSLFLSHVG